MKTGEDKLQEDVQKYLIEKGFRYWHIPRKLARKRNQLSGLFDLLCIGHQKQFWIETKDPGKKCNQWVISLAQKEFMESLVGNNIDFAISNNFKEIKAFIDGMVK